MATKVSRAVGNIFVISSVLLAIVVEFLYSYRNVSLVKKCEHWFLEVIQNDVPGDGIGPLSLEEDQVELLQMVSILFGCRSMLWCCCLLSIVAAMYIAYKNKQHDDYNKNLTKFYAAHVIWLLLLLCLLVITWSRAEQTYKAIAGGIKQALDVGAVADGLEMQLHCTLLPTVRSHELQENVADCLPTIRAAFCWQTFFMVNAACLLVNFVWICLQSCYFENASSKTKKLLWKGSGVHSRILYVSVNGKMEECKTHHLTSDSRVTDIPVI